ncbi:hypothetical protein [Kitasatospora sp. NPDC090091]|uniref:hypothetical protein n=1 Tax=Kitasatospora sp. NPDC090091 TaxID=3364081 RepID=UPI00380C4C36
MVSPGFSTGPVSPASPPGAPHNPAPDTVVPISAPGASPFAAGPTPSPSPGPPPTPPNGTTRLDRPYELCASAGIARQVATELDNANGKGGNNLAEHASGAAAKIRGFAFGGALVSCTERWLQQCRSLHDKLSGTAEKLDVTQCTYQANEHSTAGQFGH